MNENKTDVMKFIHHFSAFGQDVIDCFTKGNCFWFAAMLQARFPEGVIMYAPIDNHFGCLINKKVYDITGDVTNDYPWQLFNSYKYFDSIEYARLLRDCVYFKEDI